MKRIEQLAQTTLVLLSLFSLIGAIIYRFYSLNQTGVITTLILVVIAFFIIQFFSKKTNLSLSPSEPKTQSKKFSLISFLLLASYFLLLTYCLYLLFSSQTSAAIISPWQVVPKYFFIFYFLATLVLIANLLNHQPLSLLLIIFHYFLSFSVAIIVYQIGYGYDPFIHQATTALIDKIGAVEPKPFYYLGQYSLVVILHKLTGLSLVWLDKLLVPLAAAIFLPLILWRVLKIWFDDRRVSLIMILLLLSLTFNFFIITTPQNLAYFFLLLIILFGLVCSNYYDLIIIYLLALTSLVIQPIAGIPAILFALLLTCYHSNLKKLKIFCFSSLILLLITALPLSFYFLDKTISPTLTDNANSQIKQQLFSKITNPDQENFILNFIYFYGFNLKILIIFLVIIGWWLAYRWRRFCQIYLIYFLTSVSLIIAYFLSLKLPFSFLISYERGDFLDRILLEASFFSLPFIILVIYSLIEKILKQNKIIKFSWLIFFSLLITGALYLSYPRYDNYFNSHSYAVSASDLMAVNWINQDAGKPYFVLANQQVSAAALRQFGFNHYFKNQIFYYPIPTGGPLYQYYLDMVYQRPSRQTISQAMDLTGTELAYFVINKYWWAFPKIIEEAKLEADSWQIIDNSAIYIFKYQKL